MKKFCTFINIIFQIFQNLNKIFKISFAVLRTNSSRNTNDEKKIFTFFIRFILNYLGGGIICPSTLQLISFRNSHLQPVLVVGTK